jgi:hypothetical protein
MLMPKPVIVLRPHRLMTHSIPTLAILSAVGFGGPPPRPTVHVELDVSAIDEVEAGDLEMEARGRTELILDARGYFLDEAAADLVVVRFEHVNREDHEYGIHIYV